MGCINTKKRLTQVQSADIKEEKFHEFGLKKQDSFNLYDSNNPKGLISKHIQQRNARKTFSNINSTPAIDLEEAYPSPSKGTTAQGKRTSIMVSQFMSTPNIDNTIHNASTKFEVRQNSKENTPSQFVAQCS